MSVVKQYSLISQLRFKISIRILICLCFSFLTLLFLTYRDVAGGVELLNKQLNVTCQELEEFIISQVLIDGENSISLKLDEINKAQQFRIEWISDQAASNAEKIVFKAPFDWAYSYNLKALDGRTFGMLRARGSFFHDKVFLSEFRARGFLILSLCIFLFALLFPLAKKIPREMILNPIQDILSLLKNTEIRSQNRKEMKFLEVEEIKHEIIQLVEKIKRSSHDAAIAKIAAQVAHDIRSPLASMEANLYILMKDVSKEKLRMMNLAIQSVRDISNNLLEQYRTQNTFQTKEILNEQDDANVARFFLLFSLVDQVVSQKKYEWLNKSCELIFDFSLESKSMWIKAAPAEVKRMISNLLNNAIEACGGKAARIHLTLTVMDKFLEFRIIDNGIGMPENMIDLYLHGVSSKHVGEGLGLSAAKNYIKSIGGKIDINSTLNNGSTILLKFIHSSPDWHPGQILLAKDDQVVILDDDVAMQSLWMHKLESHPVKVHFFNNYKDAESWIKNNLYQHEKLVLLVDHEFCGEAESGLMLLKKYGLGSDSYLVTSHAEELFIQKEVDKLKIKLIPKFLVNDVEIKIV